MALMHLKHSRNDPVLITGAPPSPRAELDYRMKRYAITMGVRIVCLILAAVFYKVIWLWPIFALGAIALPWIAVMLANDRLPRKATRFQRFVGIAGERQLGPGRRAPAERPDGQSARLDD